MRLLFATLCLLVALPLFAAEPEDKDLLILQLRRTLMAEKLERLRMEFILTRAEHERLSAEIAKREQSKSEVQK